MSGHVTRLSAGIGQAGSPPADSDTSAPAPSAAHPRTRRDSRRHFLGSRTTPPTPPGGSTAIASTLACERCRRLKKRCDKSFPECSLCQKAGSACRYPDPFYTAINRRLSWLSEFVDRLLPGDVTIQSLETGADLGAVVSGQPEPANPAGTSVAHERLPDSSPRAAPLSSGTEFAESLFRRPGRLQLPQLRGLPAGNTPARLVQAYLNEYYRTLPMMDKDWFLSEAEPMMEAIVQGSIDMDLESLRLYLIMALGYTIFAQSGEPAEYPDVSVVFRIPYPDAVNLCLERRSMTAVQVLLLLTFFSQHDPAGWSPWTLTAILAREAISSGLDSKVHFESDMSRKDIEARYRLYWSIFSVDRFVSVTYGLPFALRDNARIPSPGITADELSLQPHDSILTLQVARHSMALRELEGKVLSRIHLESYRGSHHAPDCCRHGQLIIDDFRLQVDNWYTQGCLYARMDTYDGPMHNTITWLTANYHRVLLLLYYPSNFWRCAPSSESLHLQHAINNFVESMFVQFEDKQFPPTHIAQGRLAIICRGILHCYSSCKVAAQRAGLESTIDKCINILRIFGPQWLIAMRCRTVLQRLRDHVQSCETAQSDPVWLESHKEGLESITQEAIAMIRDGLGESSVYNFVAYQDCP